MSLAAIVADPDFVTTFQIVTEAETIGTNGRATIAEASATVSGAVVPDAEPLKRQPDGSRLSGSIKVYTAHAIVAASAGRAADVVIWGGARYTVMSVADYTRWDGLRVASCELVDINR